LAGGRRRTMPLLFHVEDDAAKSNQSTFMP
jgi:hypothetical protein